MQFHNPDSRQQLKDQRPPLQIAPPPSMSARDGVDSQKPSQANPNSSTATAAEGGSGAAAAALTFVDNPLNATFELDNSAAAQKTPPSRSSSRRHAQVSVDGGKLDVADALREERLANRSVTRDTPYENLGYWDLHGTKVISLIVAQILFIVYTIVLWLESLPDFVDVMTGYPGVASSALDVYYGHSAVVGIGCLMVLLRAFRNLSLYTCRWKAHRKKLSKKRTFSQYRCCRAVYWYRRWVARSHAPYYPWWVFRAEVLECTFQAIAFAEFSWNGHSRTALIIYATVIMINATASPWLLATSRITLGAAIDITSDLFYSVYPMAMLLALYFDSEENKRWPHPATHAYLVLSEGRLAFLGGAPRDVFFKLLTRVFPIWSAIGRIHQLVALKVLRRMRRQHARSHGNLASSLFNSGKTAGGMPRQRRPSFFSRVPTVDRKQKPLPKWVAAVFSLTGLVLYSVVIASLLIASEHGCDHQQGELGSIGGGDCVTPVRPVFDSWTSNVAEDGCKCRTLFKDCFMGRINSGGTGDDGDERWKFFNVSSAGGLSSAGEGSSSSSSSRTATMKVDPYYVTHIVTHDCEIGAASMRAITAFTNLQILHLTAASLSSLPVGLVKLSRLVSLKVNHNAITALHSNIARMTSLLFLEAMNNSLVNLPEPGLGALTNLKEAYLQYNALTELPESFGQITGLQQLHVDGNGLQSLDLTGLVELHELQASFNNFTTLYRLGGMRMRHGRGLQLRGNPQLEAVDLSVVREGDADAFLSLSRDVAVRLGQLPRPTTSSQSLNTPDQLQHQQLRNLRVYDPINATHVNADKPVFDVHLARWRWGSRIPCCCYLYGRGIPSRLLGAVKEGEVSDVDGGEAGVEIECRADYERFPW